MIWWKHNPLWLIMGLLITGLLLFTADRLADQHEKVQKDFFHAQVADLAKISESTLVGKLQQYDDVLLVLRNMYVDDPKRITENISLLRNGPLSDREILVVLVDREGYLSYTDTHNVKPRMYLGDRTYFRYFADGGKDCFYIDEPVFGRVTKRYSIPLVRPLYDKQGNFSGVVAFSVRQDSLADFKTLLELSGDTTVTVVVKSGAVAGRSRDLDKFQGTKLSQELLEPLLKAREGIFSSRATLDGVERIIAFQHVYYNEKASLIVYVEASLEKVMSQIFYQRTLLIWGTGFISFIIMALIVFYLKNKEIMQRLIDILRKSKEQEYEILTNTSLDGFLITDGTGRFLDTNDTFCKMIGWSREELLCLNETDIEVVRLPEQIVEHFPAIIENGYDRFKSRYQCKDGIFIDIEVSAQYLKESGGCFFTFIRDITESNRIEKALTKSEERFREISENMADWIWEVDSSGRYSFCSEKVEKILGYSSDEMIGKTPFDFMPPTEAEKIGKIFIKNVDRKEPIKDLENWNISKDGRQICLLTNAIPILSKNGDLLGYRGIDKNITDKKKAELAKKESEARYRSMMESITDQLYICSPDYTIEYMNPAMLKHFGRDATGETCHQVLHNLDTRCDWCVFDEVKQGEKTIETTITSPLDGRTYRITNMPIQNTNGTVSKMSLYRDITDYLEAVAEKNKAQTQLLQAQKMESIGTLAGGIAHDFNNILYPIIGFAQLSINELPENHPVKENLEDILTGAKRAGELVKQILKFSRQAGPEYQSIQIQPVIEEALKLLRSTIPANIDIQHELYKDARYIFGDATEIYEIIMNLCTNAYHAMEETGGTLKVSLYEKTPDSRLDLPPGEYCCLSISDTGTGIAYDVIDNIFEPYFTTKELGKGTGLGLSVVHGIVKNCKGDIIVESKPDKGTTFFIYLPLISERIKSDHIHTTDKQKTGGNENILFVDDEKSIVKLGTRILERLGYNVTGKINCIEALELFRTMPEAFDLVITDMAMPSLSGVEFAKKLIEIRPDIPIIICTGFSEKLDQEIARSIGIRAYLRKPIIMDDLCSKVREMLDHDTKG